MNIIAWGVNKWSNTPEKMEFVRETDKFYVREDGRRDAKRTSWSRIYPDLDQAQSAIKARKDSEEAGRKTELMRRAAPDLLDALEATDECAEILRGLIENIEAEGNYSAESMINFLNQALGCHYLSSAALAKARGES